MPVITIQGTIINFPDSGSSPNWSQPIIDFAKATEAALNSFVGPFDIPPQIYIMTSNANTNVDLPNLSFPTADVQGAIISYSVFRNTNSQTITETGSFTVNYNSTRGSGLKWSISREYQDGAQVTFSITDVGQIQFSSTLIAGTGHNGTIVYQAKAILQGS